MQPSSRRPRTAIVFALATLFAFVGVRDQHVVDQFNTDLRLDLRKPTGLLVPTFKSLNGPAPTPAPADVDHFQCYKVAASVHAPRFVAVPGVTIEDQFGSMTVT